MKNHISKKDLLFFLSAEHLFPLTWLREQTELLLDNSGRQKTYGLCGGMMQSANQ